MSNSNQYYETKDGWILYTRKVILSSGREQEIYFFSRRVPKNGIPCKKPKGYVVRINQRTGLPYLTKPYDFRLDNLKVNPTKGKFGVKWKDERQKNSDIRN